MTKCQQKCDFLGAFCKNLKCILSMKDLTFIIKHNYGYIFVLQYLKYHKSCYIVQQRFRVIISYRV